MDENIKAYFFDTFSDKAIDNQTAKDCNFDLIFNRVDYTVSSVGREYLYKLLGNPVGQEELDKRQALIASFEKMRNDSLENNDDSLYELMAILKKLSSKKKISFYNYISYLNAAEGKGNSNAFHIFCLAGLVAGFITTAFFTVPGVILIVSFVALNIISYFACKSKLDPYLETMLLISNMANFALEADKLDIKGLDSYKTDLITAEKEIHKIYRHRRLLRGSVTGSILSFFTDYFFMLTHLDLITFNQMLNTAVNSKDTIIKLFDTIGFIDSMLSVCSYRESLESYCLPELTAVEQSRMPYICAKELKHPLVNNCVANDIDIKNSMLLTGSNASGKSTFLREVMVNLILAQTIYTVCAKEFSSNYVKVLSSMSVTDSLVEGKSFFFTEIDSVKRIIDYNDKLPLVCFVDEMFKGTNTNERIAANLSVLTELNNRKCLVFAASHDLELCSRLKDFENYHFEEDFKDNDMYFNYKLLKGQSDSTNAIKLMEAMGFSKEIIDRANQYRK